ncbi:hypothetical protein [uncultured Clostridium sp.]|uniref:hypothetical protein n=1 Tax=uncultured Clostridium sp. TaxID=59620 RepID=UPI00272DE37D|nr:hypothetical protein [uncultured Clostridium sp.]
MDREKIKLDENIKNKKDLIKIIEEKEIEIENQKLKLQLANEEIEKIKLELEQLKREISESIVDTFNIDLKEKRLSNIIEISEKEKSNISIELVEINEEEFRDEHINDIENETDVMGKKDSANEDIRVDNDIIVEELGVNSIEEKEEDELTLIERLKLVFIENKDSDIKQILDEILNSIIDIEDTIRFENKIFLLYIYHIFMIN